MCREYNYSNIEIPIGIDDGTDPYEKIAKISSALAHFRSANKRLEVQYRDLKQKYNTDIEKL